MRQRNNTIISPEHVAWLRAFADAKGGISQAANFLGLSRNALTRAVAQLGIHRGTAALLAQQIETRAKARIETPLDDDETPTDGIIAERALADMKANDEAPIPLADVKAKLGIGDD